VGGDNFHGDIAERGETPARAADAAVPAPTASGAPDRDDPAPTVVPAGGAPGHAAVHDDTADRARAAAPDARDHAATENGVHDERATAGVAGSVHALRSRLENLFASNGAAAAEEEPEDAIPGPRRSASAARARAEATVAARRSPAELWALRILAAVLVAVLLIAFLLILTSIA